MIERVVAIPADHPCLPGHFPGRPIVPAVLILDEVRALMADHSPGQSLASIDHCKFQDFVLPDRPFRIALEPRAGSAVDFTCTALDDGHLLAKGRLRLKPSSAST